MSSHLLHQVTTWASAGIAFATSIAYFMRARQVLENFRSLGYPDYLPLLLGAYKLLGSVALVAPVSPVIREWAYAGFTFNYSGAFVSHLACKQVKLSVSSVVVFVLLAISYATRP
jgi:hypothetical protein